MPVRINRALGVKRLCVCVRVCVRAERVNFLHLSKLDTRYGKMSPKVLCQLPASAVPCNRTVFRILECIESQIQY
jgi:hypothetical protein